MSFLKDSITESPQLAYYPELVKPLGGVSAAILFSYFLNKSSKGLAVHKTAEEIERETGLTVQEQRTARRKLRDAGVLEETKLRLEHKIYYKVDRQVVNVLFELAHTGVLK